MTDEQRKARAERCRQMGTLGGQKTVQTYGPAFMRAIGSAGFKTTCTRYYSGNAAHARAALIAKKPLSFRGNGSARKRPPPQAAIDTARMAAAAD